MSNIVGACLRYNAMFDRGMLKRLRFCTMTQPHYNCTSHNF